MTERLRGLKDSGLGDRDEILASRQPPISPIEPAVISALRELAAEAAALRRTVERTM